MWKYKTTCAALVVGFILGLILFEGIASVGNKAPEEEEHISERRARRSAPSNGSVRNATPVPDGAIYTRWGRPDCPSSSKLVYKGIMASGNGGHTGGGTEYVCLPEEPEWSYETAVAAALAEILYGVEFQTNFFSPAVAVNQNALCAVCQSTRKNSLMIPGRKTCLSDWSREYFGYLMNSKHNDKSGRRYICVDTNPSVDRSGARADGGTGLWHVTGSCPSIPCPTYKHYIPLTCVVCSR